jgi:hypothetical protein
MRLLTLLALVACRQDPDDFVPKPDTAGVDDTAVDTDDTDDTAIDTDDTDDTDLIEDIDADGFTVAQGDCDDEDAALFPGADEVCDGLDQDCDGVADEGVTGTFWADADGDGYGDPATSLEACAGAADNDDDCDDTRADVNPGAAEVCDDVDSDCDGAVDEEGLTLWFTDADGDTFGDPTTGALDCAPEGRVASWEDCDDADAAVFPGATEVCDGVDQDCDGGADEGLTSTWYIDYDSDGYGSDAYTRGGCTQPAGYVAEDDDCDDTEGAVNPGATEVCNTWDDDCDGEIDEDSAADASTWYVDADGDGWGDTTSPVVACDTPDGFVAPDGDCDDTDATAYPGAPERYDGADDDCDGAVDDNTWVGTGADGALSVTGVVDLSTDASGGRAHADGAAYAVTALDDDTITLATAAAGLAAGDEVLLVNLQGSTSAYGSVGAYEFGWVASVSGSTVTLDTAVAETYGAVSNVDLTGQVVTLVRVPQYTDVTVGTAGMLTTGAWDGATGGVLAFRATGTVSIAAGGGIVMDEAGYAGGSTGTAYNYDAFQGESYGGEGQGNGAIGYNEYLGWWANNLGAGGAHVTGGGGNHGGGATAGDSWNGGPATPPEAGDTYGDVDLSRLFLGSGGGGVWRGTSSPGPGGGGGGIVFVAASAVTAEGAAAITTIGGTTPYWATGTWTYGAGGGAGGSVWIVADTLTLAGGAIDAQGGLGESTHIRAGGDGGVGRVRVDCVAVNGAACTAASGGAALDTASEPDAGYVAVP